MSKHDPTASARHRRLITKRYNQRITGTNGRPFHHRAPHGTPNGYRHYGCRCNKCCQAATEDQALKRQRHRAAKRQQQLLDELNP